MPKLTRKECEIRLLVKSRLHTPSGERGQVGVHKSSNLSCEAPTGKSGKGRYTSTDPKTADLHLSMVTQETSLDAPIVWPTQTLVIGVAAGNRVSKLSVKRISSCPKTGNGYRGINRAVAGDGIR